MARLNITVPDALYARLEQLRDRINLSKVCASALEKEVIMLEGHPPISDPRIARLLQRLQSARERWHQHGYEDGIGWAVDLATRDELQNIATYLADLDGRQLAEFFQLRDKLAEALPSAPQPTPLPSFPFQVPDVPRMSGTRPDSKGVGFLSHRAGPPIPIFPLSFHPTERLQYWQEQDRESSTEAPPGEAGRPEVDESAYLEGWRDAVNGIWQTISPAFS
jgi:ribosome modulation factor